MSNHDLTPVGTSIGVGRTAAFLERMSCASRTHGSKRGIIPVTLVTLVLFASLAIGQKPRHFRYNAQMPPGVIGQSQVFMRPELHGHFQAVQINVPEGAHVSVADGDFQIDDTSTALVGLQVGQVYRLRIRNVPGKGEKAVYPTVELIDRLHPPPGKELRHPVPIGIAAEDIALALAGNYVTRVVYVEDPRLALPVRETPGSQRYFETLPQEDPLQVAGELGRPIAIVRMGSLTPDANGPDEGFLFGSPPVVRHPTPDRVDQLPDDQQVDQPERASSTQGQPMDSDQLLPPPRPAELPDLRDRDGAEDEATSPLQDVPPDPFEDDLTPDTAPGRIPAADPSGENDVPFDLDSPFDESQ